MDDMRIRAKVCSQKKITDRDLIVMEYYKLLDVPWRSRTKRSLSPWDPRSVLWIEARGSWQKVKRRRYTNLGGCSNIKRTGGARGKVWYQDPALWAYLEMFFYP